MATQNERRTATRRALLDAAATVLVESGTAGFTTAAVSTGAGLSNGALFRHFPTRDLLLAATAEHVLARLRDGYEARFRSLDEAERTPRALLDVLWRIMNDEELAAIYELFTQARTDTVLRAALQPIVEQHGEHLRALAIHVNDEAIHLPAELAGPLSSLAVLAMQGLVLNNLADTWLDTEPELIDTLNGLFEANVSTEIPA